MTLPFSSGDEAAAIRELIDRECIRDCLFRYARGIDRRDRTLVASAFWPDANLRNDLAGEPYGFLDPMLEWLDQFGNTVHSVTNVLIRIEGDAALVESLVDGFHQVIAGPEPTHDVVIVARYHDRFERRSGEWRIAHRRVTLDWFRVHPDSGDWSTGVFYFNDKIARIGQPDGENWKAFSEMLP